MFRGRLENKLLILLSGIFCLSFFLVIGISLWQKEHFISHHYREMVEEMALTIERVLHGAMLAGQPETAEIFIKDLSVRKGLYQLDLARVDGYASFRDNRTISAVNRHLGSELFNYRDKQAPKQVFAPSDPAYNKAWQKGQESYLREEHDGRPLLTLVRPIKNEDRCYQCHGQREEVRGIMRLSIGLEGLQEDVYQARKWALITLLTGLALSLLLLTGSLKKWLFNPLYHIGSVMKEVGSGNLSKRVSLTTGDELADIGHIFNQMAENLKSYQDKIMEYSANLEAMVEERTKELEVKNATLSTLNSISTILNQSLELEIVMNDTLEKLLELMGLKGGWILLQRDGGRLHLLTHKGLSEEFVLEEATKEIDNCVCGKVLETGETMVARDMLQCPVLSKIVIEEEGLRSHASIPLKAKDKVLGVLNVASNGYRQFTPEDLALLTAVGNQIGIVIDNVQLFQNLQVSYKNLLETQTQLIQAGKMSAIGELAGGVAHEFNNLMTGIRGYAELARQRGDEKTVSKALDVILTSSDRAKALTTKLLAFCRSTESTFQRISIEYLINDTLALVERQMEIDNICIIKDFNHLPPVMADQGKLQQAFLNLLINAYHAMADGGTLTICARIKRDKFMSPEKFVEISFQDTGCGIPQEDLDRIFDPFFTTKGPLGGSSIPGTGLGLSLAYRFVRDHNGTIAVESEVGKGSTFTVTLPIEQDKV